MRKATTFIILIWLVMSNAGNMATQEDECLEAFHAFAYQGPAETYEFEGYILPIAPWVAVSDVPPHPFTGYYDHISELYVAITRRMNTQNEIWLTGRIYSLELPTQTVIARYETKSQLWEYVDTNIIGTEFHVNDLLVTSDGVIWGIIEWRYLQDTSHLTHMPVLSRFNEDTRRFEFPERATDTLLTPNMPTRLSSPLVLIDQEDVFWVFVDNDGLYRYDPGTLVFEKMVDLEFKMGYATLAPDRSIYFDRREIYLIDEEMFQFVPATQELITIPAPGKSWPLPIGMLVDRKGQLWLGVSGYRDADGTWNLIYPSPEAEEFFEYLGYPLNGPPMLLLESSDGRFWYRKYHDSGGWNEGAAWYNPVTDEGCMFTNYPATLVEDSGQNMWLVADGVLYKYSLHQ